MEVSATPSYRSPPLRPRLAASSRAFSAAAAPPCRRSSPTPSNSISLQASAAARGRQVDLFGRIGTRGRGWRRPLVFSARASGMKSSGSPSRVVGGLQGRILVGSAVTVVLAVANRVLYKLALVPLKDYPFFMAQMTTFGYVAIYFTILFLRYRIGIVTKEMLALPKFPFMAIGILEALGLAAGMSAGAMLPGPTIPILSQTFLVWQIIFSSMILGRRYSFNQIVGCLLVASGVILAMSSGLTGGQFLTQVEFVWPALMIASSAFQAGASVLKEFVFIDSAKHLQGKLVDIFVVNSFGSGFQALFVFLLLPFLSNMRGIPFSELPTYLRNGAGCFMNIDTHTTGKCYLLCAMCPVALTNHSGCEGAPLLPLLFMAVNIGFNISLLSLVKITSALVSSLAATLAVPISIYILTLPLPYIPEGTNLDTFFVLGTGILVLGLLLYNLPQAAQHHSKAD
ncbi:hypothetical protein Taro_002507 [Colocasia esculenta]|uniref:Uncharacterized protein n=1 Tax=Colocasia esculenta TaxID=4460 RepID=A0A843TL62_COLES|nr:hypothetical protein [Colocasia esculenta]